MKTQTGGRLLLFAGFLACLLSYSSWIALRTVFDPGASRRAAQTLLETAAVRDDVHYQLREQLAHALRRRSTDPSVRAAVNAALEDPQLVEAMADGIEDAHRSLLENADHDVVLDRSGVTGAVRSAVAARTPKLVASLAQQDFGVELDSERLPHLATARDLVRIMAWVGAIAGTSLLTASLLLDHERRAIARVGRRVVYLAILPLLVFGLMPLALPDDGGIVEVSRALLHSYGMRVLPSAIALGVLGVAIALASLAMRKPQPGHSSPISRSASGAPTSRMTPGQTPVNENAYL